MTNGKDLYDKLKIWTEVIAITISVVAIIWGGYKYFHSLNVDKSQLLYKDFVINGLIPLELRAIEICYAHFGTNNPKSFNRFRSIVSNLPPGIRFKELKEKYSAKIIQIDPLTKEEKKQIKKASEEAVDLLNSRLFFLGFEITMALNYSINLLRDETASIPSPVSYFSSPTDLPSDHENKPIFLLDAYRYLILVNNNHRFLRDSLKAIADFILKENIHTYQEMTQIPSQLNNQGIASVLDNLRKFKSLYLDYVNNWEGKPEDDCLQKNTEQLVLFFEDYMRNESSLGRP